MCNARFRIGRKYRIGKNDWGIPPGIYEYQYSEKGNDNIRGKPCVSYEFKNERGIGPFGFFSTDKKLLKSIKPV